jgi:hypothetical protein
MKRFNAVWMNEAEVEFAAQELGNDPILGPAARFLQDFKDFVNATTDGWAYHGTAQAAGELQGMLKEAMDARRGWISGAPVTRKDVERVCKVSITNLKRRKHYQRIDVTAYGASWPVLGM